MTDLVGAIATLEKGAVPEVDDDTSTHRLEPPSCGVDPTSRASASINVDDGRYDDQGNYDVSPKRCHR